MIDHELNKRLAAIEASIKTEGLITRRHMDVVVEGLRTDIRAITEGRGDPPQTDVSRTDDVHVARTRVRT